MKPKFVPFPMLTPAQLAAVKRRGWHRHAARNSREWHLRYEISHEYYRLIDADGNFMQSVARYDEASRIVLDRYYAWRHKYLDDGYAYVYQGKRLVYAKGARE